MEWKWQAIRVMNLEPRSSSLVYCINIYVSLVDVALHQQINHGNCANFFNLNDADFFETVKRGSGWGKAPHLNLLPTSLLQGSHTAWEHVITPETLMYLLHRSSTSVGPKGGILNYITKSYKGLLIKLFKNLCVTSTPSVLDYKTHLQIHAVPKQMTYLE